MNNNDPWASVRRDSGRGCGWIKQTQRFLDTLYKAETAHDKMAVMTEYPEIYQALWIYEQHEGHQHVRWGIEARILARQSDDEIARIIGCSSSTIGAYEALFFNVRDRLCHADYIFTSVLGQVAIRGIQSGDDGLLWKVLGYQGGPHVLDAMIGQLPNPVWASRAEDIPAFFQDAAINLMKKKAAVAALAVPVDSHTRLPLIEAFVKYVEVERTTDAAGHAQDQIQENLQGLLESLPFTAVGIADVKRMQLFDTGAAEIRTDELLMTAVGMDVPGVDSLHKWRFPEQESKQ